MSDFREYLGEQLENPDFAAEYEALRPEYEAIRDMIAACQGFSVNAYINASIDEKRSGTTPPQNNF